MENKKYFTLKTMSTHRCAGYL